MSKVPCRRSFEDERGTYPIEYDGLNMLLVAIMLSNWAREI